MEIEYTTAHIADLERSIAEIKIKKREVTNLKIQYEGDLTNLKSRLKQFPRDRKAQELVVSIKEKLADINMRILKFNAQISEKAVLKQDIEKAIKDGKLMLKATSSEMREHNDKIEEDSELRLKFIGLKDKYLDFAGDHTRVSSMRQMAADFVKELETILKNKRLKQ